MICCYRQVWPTLNTHCTTSATATMNSNSTATTRDSGNVHAYHTLNKIKPNCVTTAACIKTANRMSKTMKKVQRQNKMRNTPVWVWRWIGVTKCHVRLENWLWDLEASVTTQQYFTIFLEVDAFEDLNQYINQSYSSRVLSEVQSKKENTVYSIKYIQISCERVSGMY